MNTHPRTIKIIEDNIDHGITGNTFSCMVAEGLKSQLDLPPGTHVMVNYSRADIGEMSFPLPGWVGKRIARWDKGSKGKPFEFDIELPDDWRDRLSR